MRNRKNPFGWDYPPGAEHDPRAPYNQIEFEPSDEREEEEYPLCFEEEYSKEDYLADRADAIRKYGKEA